MEAHPDDRESPVAIRRYIYLERPSLTCGGRFNGSRTVRAPEVIAESAILWLGHRKDERPCWCWHVV